MVNGYTPKLDERLPSYPKEARKLLAEAGYSNGFEVKMNCPNDRYVNDADICQAVAAMLGRIGVEVEVIAETKTIFSPKRCAARFRSTWQVGRQRHWMHTMRYSH